MGGIKKNFAYQSIYQVTTIILPLITSPYIARVLGASNLGIYSYTYAIAYYFCLFSLLGISNHGNRIIAGVRDNSMELKKTFSNLLAVHCILAGIAIIAYYGYVFFSVKEDFVCALIQGLWVISSFFDISWLFFGLEKFRTTVTINTLSKILMTVCVFMVIKNENDIWKYCLIMAGGTLLSQALLWPYMNKYFDFHLINGKDMLPHLKPLFILFIPAIAISMYKYMDKIMLGIMSTKAQVGFYENAERAINIPISIIASFGTVMLPKMSNLAMKNDDNATKRYIMLSVEFVMCLTIAMSLGMAGVADNFSIIFWGDGFRECGPLIQILSFSILFVAFANIIRMQYLIPKKKDRAYITSVFVGAGINVIINLFLIKYFGAIGASIGTLAAEAAVCLVQVCFVYKELPIRKYIQKIIPFIFIGLIMVVIVFSLKNVTKSEFINLIIQIVVGAFSYSTLCYIYFKKSNNEYFNEMLKNIVIKIRH